mgnify:CR=1 FL=1
MCVSNNGVFIFEKNADMAVDKLVYYVKLQRETFNDKKELNTYLPNVENAIIIFLDNNIPKITLKCLGYGNMNKLVSYSKKRKILTDVKVVYVGLELPEQLKEKLNYAMDDIVQNVSF